MFSSFEFISGLLNERTLAACSRRASGNATQHFLKKTMQMNEFDHRILALRKQQRERPGKGLRIPFQSFQA